MQPFRLLPAASQDDDAPTSACGRTTACGNSGQASGTPFASVPSAFDDASSEDDDGDISLPSGTSAQQPASDAQIRAEALQSAQTGQLGKAITQFKQFLKYNSGDSAAWEMLAQLQMETEQMFDSVKVSAQHLKRGRNDTTLCAFTVCCQGSRAKAIVAHRSANTGPGPAELWRSSSRD